MEMPHLVDHSRSADVVITGVGVVSPIGVGRQAFWNALLAGQSGIDWISQFDAAEFPVRIAGEVRNFDAKEYVRPRKNLKIMSRCAQFAVAAVELACVEARLESGAVDPDRYGVVFGADRIRNSLEEIADAYRSCMECAEFDFQRWGQDGAAAMYPLSMLKNLPNMLASHISIAKDARGPNNTVCSAEASGLLAIGEAAAVIARGAADVMIAGGAASRMHPYDWVRSCLYDQLSRRCDPPASAARPFDLARDGQVRGEGAAAVILESRAHAERRGAPVLARIAGWGSSFDNGQNGSSHCSTGIMCSVAAALRGAQLKPTDVGHVGAHGLGTPNDDRREARALAEVLPKSQVFAPKSYFGNLGAGSGAVEFAANLLALVEGIVPRTLNCDQLDPACPIQLVRDEPASCVKRACVSVNTTAGGQSAAVAFTTA